MEQKPDFVERIGTAINELDIDFSRLTFAGWLVSILSFGVGGGIAFLVSNLLARRNGWDLTIGMVFFIVIVATTTALFLLLRQLLRACGFSVTKQKTPFGLAENANRDTLQRMSAAGIHLHSVQRITFCCSFNKKSNAEAMAGEAHKRGFSQCVIEQQDTTGQYDVLFQVDIVPSLENISRTEQTLNSIAVQWNGQSDGWGIRQPASTSPGV